MALPRINCEFETRTHAVYLIGIEAGFYKIGCSWGVSSRILVLQSGCPQRIELIASTIISRGPCRYEPYTIEKCIHRRLHPHWSYGEWFRAPLEKIIEGWNSGVDDYCERLKCPEHRRVAKDQPAMVVT